MARDVAASFGEVLKELRNRKKRSRPKLAQQIGMSASAIEKWERGDVLPDRARVEDVVRALQLSDEERLLLLEAHAGYRILPSLHNLPADRNPYFTGREVILAQLHHRLAPGSQVALTQAISGLGGIGKTQAALEYVYRFHTTYSHVLWVTADSSDMLTLGFANLARDLELPEKDEKDQSKVVRAVQRWLCEYLDWLLILDNVEDLGLVSTFVPVGHLGAVLLTTRRQVTEPVAQALELDVFSKEDGALFLLKRIGRLPVNGSIDKAATEDAVVTQAITQHLGGLPLALDQAGAYILETGCALVDYLSLYEQQHAALLARRGNVPAEHPESVATTFSLALEQVQKRNPAAVELLQLCAFLAPDQIPEELITGGAEHLGPILQPLATDLLAFNEAVETLRFLSLIHRDACQKMLSLHRVVQTVLQDEISQAARQAWIERCMHLLDQAFPSGRLLIEQWDWCEQLVPHVQVSATLSTIWSISSLDAASLFQKAAQYLDERAQHGEAEPLYQRALCIQKHALGPDHPDLATSLNGLANLYARQGKYAKAEPLYQRALCIREQALGLDHPDVARPLFNLAYLYSGQGKYEQAEPLHLRALHIWEQTLGPDDPEVANSLDGLGTHYYEQGKYEQAEPLYQRALRILEPVLGPDHPDVAYPLNNLADLFRKQGKHEQAKPLYQRALHNWEQAWGSDHPNVAHPLNGLANLYCEQSKYAEAEPLYQRALSIREQALGSQHPETAETMHGLARLREMQDSSEEASVWYARALTVREQALGAHHPKTTETRTRLITLLHTMGQDEEAAKIEMAQTKS